tara:strand:+ start:4722 stop:4982 length:261 start_codon:yes stop_codon:yes gene_type:complete
MAMKKKKKAKGYAAGGKVRRMSKGGAMGGKMPRRMSKGGAMGGKMPPKMMGGGASMTLPQLRAAAKQRGMMLSPMKKMAKGGKVKK